MIIDLIHNHVTSAADKGVVSIIKLNKTETIFSTDGLESVFPPDTAKKSKYIKTGHKVVYDIVIEPDTVNPKRILFTAMLTDLLDDERSREKVFKANGEMLRKGAFPRTQLIKPLAVKNTVTFIYQLKIAVLYFIYVAIPWFESKLSGKSTISLSAACVKSGRSVFNGNGKPTGRLSSAIQSEDEYDDNPQPVLTVKANFLVNWQQSVYLRYESYRKYTGRDWEDAPTYTDSVMPQYNAYFLTRDAMDDYNRNVNCGKYKRETIKVIPESSVEEFHYPCFAYSDTDSVDDVKIAGIIEDDHTYTLDIIPYERPRDCCHMDQKRIELERRYYDFVCKTYRNTEPVLDSVKDIVRQFGWNLEWEFWDLVGAVCGFFRKFFNYSYDFYFPEGVNIVDWFLRGKTNRNGICSHFAAAATLIFREIGLPARMTNGFVCHPNKTDTVEVTTNNAHDWVEVYKKGLGWVIVDPTPPINERTYRKSRIRDGEDERRINRNFPDIIY